jgi:hypothetical protein
MQLSSIREPRHFQDIGVLVNKYFKSLAVALSFLHIRRLEILDNSRILWVNPSFSYWSKTWRTGHTGTATICFVASCAVLPAIAGRPPLRWACTVPLISSFMTIFWITLFDCAATQKRCLSVASHCSIHEVTQYTRTSKTRCSIVYMYYSATQHTESQPKGKWQPPS